MPTVGRAREQRLLRGRLTRALVGSSIHVLLETRAGLGSTRLVSELAVEAQLAGALPQVLDERAHGEAFGSVSDVIDKLLTVARDDALAAVSGEGAPLLARFSPALARALAVAPDSTDFSARPTELRRRIIGAVVAWWVALSQRPDAERADVRVTEVVGDKQQDVRPVIVRMMRGRGAWVRKLLTALHMPTPTHRSDSSRCAAVRERVHPVSIANAQGGRARIGVGQRWRWLQMYSQLAPNAHVT